MNVQDHNFSSSSAPLPQEASHRVYGRITTPSGTPVAGATVQAFEIALRSESLLGSATTDAAGQYETRYPLSSLHHHTEGSSDLAVKVLALAGWLPAVSPVWFNAPADAEVNLTLTAAALPTGLDAISQLVTPLLEGMRVENLAEDGEHQDLTFLAGDTGLSKATLTRFALAHQLAQEALPPAFWFALLGSGAFRIDETQDLAAQREAILSGLPALDAAAVQAALARSWNSGEISDSLRAKSDEWIETFLDFAASRVVSPDAPMTLVKAAVSQAGIHDAEKRKQFARLLNEHRELSPAMLEALQKDSSFKTEEISDLSTSFQLAELTRSDFSVVKKIREDFGIHQPEDIRTLARKSESEWVQWAAASHAAGAIKLTADDVAGSDAETLGKTLARQFREAFPTAAFAGGLARALPASGVRGLKQAGKLSQFLESHPDFDLLRTPIDDFLQHRAQPQFRVLAQAQDDEDFKLEMKAVQRVFKLAPTFEATDTLLADGIHSAQKIHRMGQTQFVRSFADRPGFTAESARLAWNRAAETHAAVVTIVGDLKALDAEALPMALQSGSSPATIFPNWNDLFKAGDLCECEQCNSVLSPAAYYTDLLMFLQGRQAKGGKSVKDVLFERRPDLGYLELNCDNATVPLPYVDVVCEVIEDAIANGENDVELAGFTAMLTDPAAAKADVASRFSTAKLPLGSGFTLSPVSAKDLPNQWVVHGDEVSYLLVKKTASATANFFARVLRNTKASAEELAAHPRYVNPKAYAKLLAATHPLTLPFDLFGEEVRAAMRKVNLERWDLMRTLRGTAAPNNPKDADIAAEYFGISAAGEKDLILKKKTGADLLAQQQEIWGDFSKLKNVKLFLQKAGLEYTELLALLDLKFINPAGDITVHHQDDSCDLDKKDLTALNEEKLDRIHRFLRLWRKLSGWQMWELDLALHYPALCKPVGDTADGTDQGDPAIHDAFLVHLFYFCELRKRWGGQASVEQALALFDNLNVDTHFTKLHEKRGDGLYQSLFLNRRLLPTLDSAFEVAKVNVTTATTEKISGHHPAILAALGLREADLILLAGLPKASDATKTYITYDLTLTNLSFLWRQAWLAKSLKLKPGDWALVLKVLHQDVATFSSPKAALEYLARIDSLRAAGFTLDELNWLLAADRAAKAAAKDDDAARFLLGLRKELQAVHGEFDDRQYPFLSSPTDEAQPSGLLTTLLKKLNRDETAVNDFLAALRLWGRVLLEVSVQDLPSGFVFPPGITATPNFIPIQYSEAEKVLRFTGLMTATQRTILLEDPSLSSVTTKASYRKVIEGLFQQSQAAPRNFLVAEVDAAAALALPSGQPSIPLLYNATTKKLSFIGLMTEAERTALKGVAGNSAQVIDELFQQPRLRVKFYAPVFTAALAKLPATVDFNAQLPADLAARITYDAEERLLRFSGILRQKEQDALDVLAPAAEVAYHDAVKSLAAQPRAATSSAPVWLTDDDLDATKLANDTLAKRLANAATKALTYLSTTSSETAVVQQCSGELGLTEALTRSLLTRFSPLAPDTLLKHLTGAFVATSGVVDRGVLPATFDGWFWAIRVATVWKRWQLNAADLDPILAIIAKAQLIDFQTLPLNSTEAMASAERFTRTSRLLKVRESLPETGISLLEVLVKLNGGKYDGFADDVHLLNDAWPAADVKELVASLSLSNPEGYLLAESWGRLGQAFDFLGNLNAGAAVVKGFAAATMTGDQAKLLADLLCARFGTATWLTMSGEIQNVLRERKRDALTAYLLTQTQPGAPSGRWESADDLYAYFLLDVEMGACQQTSRLVQASGSVQLLVQRCQMGLEPDVVVKADGPDGDSAWRWYEAMSRYQVWVADRKVFLWPENWIAPELKKDRSPFFKDLESELLQNEINPDTVEKAFVSYLEKLNGVAQLEIAGFYQEDDGDDTILHVFGRTTGAEPQLYYYRCYDYRQWSAWEKVELDIQGDYLIPAVMNGRLFLFWPVFTELPDDDKNSTVDTPSAGKSDASMPKTFKKLKLQLAMSELRHGKWTPRTLSKPFFKSETYSGEIVKDKYEFWAVDESDTNGRFTVQFTGVSTTGSQPAAPVAKLQDGFEVAGCRGGLEKEVHAIANPPGNFESALRPKNSSTASSPEYLKWDELAVRPASENDFTLQGSSLTTKALTTISLLNVTPGLFKDTPPWQLSYFDRLLLGGLQTGRRAGDDAALPTRTGTWLPFFYNDEKRTFFVLPTLVVDKVRGIRSYYPDLKRVTRRSETDLAVIKQKEVETEVAKYTDADRKKVEDVLRQLFPEEPPPPYPDSQLKDLLLRSKMNPGRRGLGVVQADSFLIANFHFANFYHPFVCGFTQRVQNPLLGISALMSRSTQLQDSGLSFFRTYQPTDRVMELTNDPKNPDSKLYPRENVDFSPDGAYAYCNWELFFHAPLLIANALSREQRFAEARDWYHYIFNPIGVEPPPDSTGTASPMQKYWITKPFFETTDPQYVQQRIENLLRMLAGDRTVAGYSQLEQQVIDWRTNPFDPHRIANYRTVAYQKTVVMNYVDNLIRWGDNLFEQDTMESINEATQLYMLAAEILGPRPKKVPPRDKPPVETFNELEAKLDAFSDALVQVENLLPVATGSGTSGADAAPLPTLYFCIPQNDKLLSVWDTVADRLYKIRHCMNLEGVTRQLALFAPPIDPGALVKAVAAGVDIGAVLANLNAPLPLYRFNVLLQKANELCNDVKALGGALLAALEKRDGEGLGLLRQSQEIRLLDAVKAVRQNQVDEANRGLEGTKKSKDLAAAKKTYYESREFMNQGEQVAMDLNTASTVIDSGIAIGYTLAGGLKLIPDFLIGASGFGGTPHAVAQTGGKSFGDSAEDLVKTLESITRALDKVASLASTMASYKRRKQEWDFQADLATREMAQLDQQIAAAELRVTIAQQELDNQVLQIDNSKAIDAYLRSKYTSQELYQWQVGQVSGLYFQCYKLAYDLAKRAERCFRFELGLQDSSYIQFGYWDSLKKGLLSGEKLQYDLRRLETAYLEQNRREFELSKHVSLAQLDPLALLKLRETGRCFFHLPEEVFDLDYPGHYFRRIKSVSLTLPCVVGPYTTISCTLRLLKNSLRINTANGDHGYPRNTDDRGLPVDDPRFVETNVPVQAIAASNAQNDSGVFELSFRDDRYLPFEGAGAISDWTLELFTDSSSDFGKALRQFDYSSISDAILHLKYTAREDAGSFKNGAVAHLREYFNQAGPTRSLRLFDLQKEFPTQWSRFLNPTGAATENVFELAMEPRLFPLLDQDHTLKITTIWLLARCTHQGSYTVTLEPPLLAPPPPPPPTKPQADPIALTLAPVQEYGGLYFSQKDGLSLEVAPTGSPVQWKLKMVPPGGGKLQADEVSDVFLVLGYERDDPRTGEIGRPLATDSR